MNRVTQFVGCSVLCLGFFGCGPSEKKVAAPQPEESADAVEEPGIKFDVVPEDAEVIVDGESVGSAAEVSVGTLTLQPGLHQIMIQHPDFDTYRVEVTIADKTETLQIRLEEKSK